MDAAKKHFPPQIKFIIGNEACERFSYYGMRSILVVFMVQHLHMAEKDSIAIYHLFVSACYLLPLLGGYIADRFWGKYKTILYISLFYCLGHGVLAAWAGKTGLYVGLALIAFGAGGIKPCVSAYVADQFTQENEDLVPKVFDLFYWSVNFGSFFSTLLIPWMLPRYGASWAFGIPGILMAAATLIFWLGRNRYVQVPPAAATGSAGFAPVLAYALKHRAERKSDQEFFDVARAKFSEEDVEAAKSVADVFKLFTTVTIFWALWDQYGSSWVLQAEKMDLTVLGVRLESSQISAINPILLLTLIPVFAKWIYPAMERAGVQMTMLRRMSAGMFIAAFSFVAIGIIQAFIDRGMRLSVAWQFIPYFLISVSEIMVSITALEFAYSQAPRSMKSTLMSIWFLTIFGGDLLTAFVAEVNVFSGSAFFFFFAALMTVVSFIFASNAARYKLRDYYEKADAPAGLPAQQPQPAS